MLVDTQRLDRIVWRSGKKWGKVSKNPCTPRKAPNHREKKSR
jgi:hypothetical protein